MNYFFTSDTHYGHANIIKYAKRPFTSVEEMDEHMIRKWNEVVRPGDTVYHLGDFCFSNPGRALSIANRLMGQKFLVFGNHDKGLRKDQSFLGAWARTHDMMDINVFNQKIILCHYAMRVWNQSHRGAWQLFGHSHGSLKDDPNALSVDVGVDCWNYTPVSFDQLTERMKQKTFKPIDHHGKRDE